MARELHDSAGQTLAALGMTLATIERRSEKEDPQIGADINEAKEMVQELSQEIRTTSYLLHPPLLDESGIAVALKLYLEGLAQRSNLRIDFNISDKISHLPRDVELVVFRVVQESLTNIHRHSGSKTASIRIDREDKYVSIAIRDQGKGIPADKLREIQAGISGVGIRGMRDRVGHLNGSVNIESNDSGTTILVTLPIKENSEIVDRPEPVRPLEAKGW
jgi:two-component system NarL family sensor kinase